MEQQLKEQAHKILRYETKLRDIISAYQELQADNERLGNKLRTAESNASLLRHELEEKTHLLENQYAVNADLSERMALSTLENDNYRKEEEKNSCLRQQVDRLSKELEVEQNNSKSLKCALLEAQEQHEASTRHFEATVSKVFLTDLISTLVDSETSDAETPKVDDLFDFMRQLWRAVIRISPLQQQIIEKQLLQCLDMKSLVSIELLDVCEKEKNDLKQELETLKLRLVSFQAGTRKLPPLPSSEVKLRNESFCFAGSSETLEGSNLELQLQRARDQIKLLRKQNLTTLLELESIKRSMQSKISVAVTAVEQEAANRLAEASTRQADQLMRLESEARRYQDQTLNLLREKEEEISELRTSLFANHEATTFSHLHKTVGQLNLPSVEDPKNEEPDSTEATFPAFNEPSALHCGLVHCAERHERLMIELKKLRNSKRELEQRVETLEARVEEGQKAAREVATTRQAIFPQSTPSSPTQLSEDVSLTYVKNIIFNLLSSFNTSSFSSKMAVVRALSMALHFSPEEESAIIGGTIS
ncbi:unnamed protein product [Hydatigera taeniaeformis]|uniref:GRIP domain-containing protein n=1 Tax=Hydatigena taeniaeformis TaxID=6205 RepID=A0A0R3WHU1_HYDTA|nr:unnamed protein product [Hydatigera taeniaeformis]